jgi:hypothetical protein
MKSIFTYPDNSGTNWIDPNYYGDANSGFYQRIERLRSGNYKAWAGTAPLMNTTSIISILGRYYEAHDVQNGNENINLHSLWYYPTFAFSMREKMWPVTTYRVDAENGVAYRELVSDKKHAIPDNAHMVIKDATIHPVLNYDFALDNYGNHLYADVKDDYTIRVNYYNGWIPGNPPPTQPFQRDLQIIGEPIGSSYTYVDQFDVQQTGPWEKHTAFVQRLDFDVTPSVESGYSALVLKLMPSAYPSGANLNTGERIKLVGQWGNDPTHKQYNRGSAGDTNVIDDLTTALNGYTELYVEKLDNWTYQLYADSGLSVPLLCSGGSYSIDRIGYGIPRKISSVSGVTDWWTSPSVYYKWYDFRTETNPTDVLLEDIDLTTWVTTDGLVNGAGQWLRAQTTGWAYLRVNAFSTPNNIATEYPYPHTDYYSSPAVSTGGTVEIQYDPDSASGPGAVFEHLFFYEYDYTTKSITFYESEWSDPNNKTPIASFTANAGHAFRLMIYKPRGATVVPLYDNGGYEDNTPGLLEPYETADDMKVFLDPHIDLNTGAPFYEVDTDYIALYGDVSYKHRTGPSTYTPCARWLNTYFRPGTSTQTLTPEEYLLSDDLIELDSNGRLQNLQTDPNIIPYGSGLRGKFVDGGERTFWMTNCADTYTDPAPTPLELEEVWDTADEWLNNGYDPNKVWAEDICPRSASISVFQPSSSTLSQNGTKYVRSANYAKFKLEVEYPPLTKEQFKVLFASAQRARGQTVPFYFKLVYNGKHIMFGENNTEWPFPVRHLYDVAPGEKLITVQGFPSNYADAITAGDLIIAEQNANGDLSTAINSSDANIFGELKVRIAYPFVEQRYAGQQVYDYPYWAIVTLADDSFNYAVDYDGFYRVKVVFDLDEWK